MSAQAFGQWAGLTIIAVTVGAIGFGALQVALSVRDYFRRQAFYREWLRRSANANLPRVATLPPVTLLTSSPPCENWHRRGTYAAVGRRGGKTEQLRQLKTAHDLAHERPYSTPPEAMLLGFSQNRNGEIAVGARLDFERSIMDGDRPSSLEPCGIFGSAATPIIS